MLREFLVGWLCIMGMVVYALLVGVRKIGQKSVSTAFVLKRRFRETVVDRSRSHRHEK